MVGAAPRLDRLRHVAALASDARLAELRRAAHACAETEAALRKLDAAQHAHDASDAELLVAAAQHQRWIAQRRTQLNTELAARRAWRERCEDAARRAFGRTQALESVIARAAPRRRIE